MVFCGLNSSIITTILVNIAKRANTEFIAFYTNDSAIPYICAIH